MENMKKISFLFASALFIAGCSDSGEETNSQTADSSENEAVDSQETEDNGEDQAESDSNTETEEDSSGDAADNVDASEESETESDTAVYAGAQLNPNYFIDTHIISQPERFYLAYAIERDKEEAQTPPKQRLETSLFENDPSEQDILSSYTELTLDWPSLTIQFDQEGNDLAATSAQSVLFYDALFGISDLYGIEDITFLSPDGEQRMTVAERTVDDTINVKDERGETRGYYAIYDKELQETLFIPGGELEEPVVNESGEPLSFPETIEKMKSVEPDTFYSTAIVEGIEIVSSSITNGVATVQYTMNQDIVTEADRIVFENAIQLAALDFHAWEVRLINDTLKEKRTYPLIGQ
ncbi:hypothetical protein KP77_34570 [Jeotgalibacillus alimentarius]|uniref:Uncharacterized protein n=1 Tax=Jeotgalibacillus alimentarius TaxID=135826 RepID=A0A0C2V186_9BACL|nr:hypothetical protein [Jeotgalibacillus alimentarius]KIL42827.1 hypothetical protein KP77_34570 [Jeotgalibacillus alimentarius]